MSKNKENMIDRMINIYGFESPVTIQFCELCENNAMPDNLLEVIVKAHEECPCYEED